MIADMIYQITIKTGMKFSEIMKLPAKDVLDMMSKLDK